jgi:hypothetical protein
VAIFMKTYCGHIHEDLLWTHSWRFTVDTFMKIYCGHIHEDLPVATFKLLIK